MDKAPTQTIQEYSDSVTFKRMSLIFKEWARLYSESPESFDAILDADGKPFANYGDSAAAYFMHIAAQMDADNLLPRPWDHLSNTEIKS